MALNINDIFAVLAIMIYLMLAIYNVWMGYKIDMDIDKQRERLRERYEMTPNIIELNGSF
jgi:hypothetical protein